MSDEIASDGDRDVFREGFWADRGCSLHNVRARQHSGWLADTPSSPALDAPQSEGTAVRARAGWSVLRRPRHPKIRARFDQLFSGFSKKPTFIPEVSTQVDLGRPRAFLMHMVFKQRRTQRGIPLGFLGFPTSASGRNPAESRGGIPPAGAAVVVGISLFGRNLGGIPKESQLRRDLPVGIPAWEI